VSPHNDAATQQAATRLVEVLAKRGHTLAVAESCTGGLLGATITAVPGASKGFLGGVLAYSDESKHHALGVAKAKLAKFGSVSGAIVEAMAHGVRDSFHSDIAMAVSGIAGPDGGTPGKPVGTVWLAVLGPGALIDVHRVHIDGDRDQVRREAVAEAIGMALELLEEARLEA
jgi:PncC family amidohydrolase